LLEMLDRIKNGRKPKLRMGTEDEEAATNNTAEATSKLTQQDTSEESREQHTNSTHISTSKTTHHCIA
jgi:hypothetical protein